LHQSARILGRQGGWLEIGFGGDNRKHQARVDVVALHHLARRVGDFLFLRGKIGEWIGAADVADVDVPRMRLFHAIGQFACVFVQFTTRLTPIRPAGG
jgi:hypothetical protein